MLEPPGKKLFLMGIVFGRISEERPLYDVVHVFRDSASLPSASYGPPELRKYAPRLVSEYAYDAKTEGSNDAFRALARYIGVFGTPENRAGDAALPIAMTAPVTMGTSGPTKVSMTAPVTMGQRGDARASEAGMQVMQFGMPRTFKTVDECPRPTNPKVSVREIPSYYCVALAFNGSFVRALELSLRRRARFRVLLSASGVLALQEKENMEEKGAYLLKNVVQHFGLLPVLADPRPFYYGALALQSVPVQMWAGLAQS